MSSQSSSAYNLRDAYLESLRPNAVFQPQAEHESLMTTISTAPMEQQQPPQPSSSHRPYPQGSNLSHSAQQSFNPNANSFSQNASIDTPPAQFHSPAPSSGQNDFAPFSASTQEILKRLGASHSINAGSAQWEAARESVMKSMANSSSIPAIPSGSVVPGAKTDGTKVTGEKAAQANGAAAAAAPEKPSATPSEKRGPGRPRGRGGRPRGNGRARGKGKSHKRKRENSEQEDGSQSEASESYSPVFTVTKSGRNVQKPSQFNPAPSPVSPSAAGGATKGRRPYRRGPEFALCNKCARGHSPPSNMIVFCDGCNTPFHQWCHDPHIAREVVEVETASWFCTRCASKKEMEECPLEKRVGLKDLNLTPDEILKYLSSLSSTTLATLLQHATSIKPDLPIFAPNTHDVLQKFRGNAPMSRRRSSNGKASVNGTSATKDNRTNGKSHTQPGQEEDPSDSYAEFDNPAGDPPATYPQPGNGPIKPTPITNPGDMHWLFDDSFTAFNHYCNADSANAAGSGNTGVSAATLPDVNLMAVQGDGKGGWIQKGGLGLAALGAHPGRPP